MSPSLKAFLALVFVVVMGAILIRPILNAVDAPLVAEPQEADEIEPAGTPEPTPTPRPSPSPEPSPTPEGGLISGPFRTQPLFDRYPASCLRPAPPSDSADLIAALAGNRIVFGTPAGPTDPGPAGASSVGKVKTLLGFNQPGDLYAARSTSGDVLLSAPEGAQGADGDLGFGKLEALTWSPTSVCAVAIGEGGSLLVLPSRGPSQLVREGVKAAAFSPDGRRLAVVVEEGKTTSVWVADLNGTTLREVHRVRTGPPVALEAWSPDGLTVYMSFGPDSGLSFVTVYRTSVPPLSGRVGAARVIGLEQCGDRLLGVVDGALADISTRGPDHLTQTNVGYTAVSCAPNGSFLAAIRDNNLFLLDGNGRELRDLTLDSGFEDVFVDWGASGLGLLFGRVPDGGGVAQVWHIPEGGSARNTGLSTPGDIDWAASPPTGVPAR